MYAFYNSELNAAPQIDGIVFVANEQQQFANANSGLPQPVLAFQGAKLNASGSITTHIDVNLTQLLGSDFTQTNAAGATTQMHASGRLTLTSADVSPATWVSLSQYAADCAGKSFSRGRLELVAGSGAYHAAPECSSNGAILFALDDRGDVTTPDGSMQRSILIVDLDIQGDVSFVNLVGSSKVVTLKKQNSLFGATPAATIAAPASPVAVRRPVAATANPFAK